MVLVVTKPCKAVKFAMQTNFCHPLIKGWKEVSPVRVFYSLKGLVTRSISLSIIFFEKLGLGINVNEGFLFKTHSSHFP
jgi:hypothetical protein